jgi:hypothetical protein
MLRQQPRRPQLMRIAQILGLATGQIDQPSPGLDGDRGLPAGSRTVVQRRHHARRQRPLDAALHGLVMHTLRPANREERRLLAIRLQHPRPHHPCRRFRPRARDHAQLRQIFPANAQIKLSSRGGHGYVHFRQTLTNAYHTSPLARKRTQLIGSLESMN